MTHPKWRMHPMACGHDHIFFYGCAYVTSRQCPELHRIVCDRTAHMEHLCNDSRSDGAGFAKAKWQMYDLLIAPPLVLIYSAEQWEKVCHAHDIVTEYLNAHPEEARPIVEGQPIPYFDILEAADVSS